MTAEAVWPLLAEPTTEGPPITEPEQTGQGNITQLAFLGNGLLRPFQRDQKDDFANSHGVRLVQSAVGQVLGVIAQGPGTQGEFPWRTEFGSWVELLRQRQNTEVLEDIARVYVADAIRRWEPRARVRKVKIERRSIEQQEDALFLRVSWDPINVAKPQNRIVLNGLETIVPLA